MPLTAEQRTESATNVCDVCDKVIFPDQAAAEARAAELGMRAYLEPRCNWWHLTSQLDAVAHGHELPALGLHYDLPEKLYHTGPGVGSHDLRNVLRSPAHFKAWRENPNDPTPAMVFGTAFHSLVLEPEIFERSYGLAPERPAIADGRAKKETPAKQAYLAWQDELAAFERSGITPLDPKDWDRLHRMRESVMAHPYASIYLDPDAGPTEVTAYWVDPTTHKLCRARYDKLNEAHGAIVDLKTAIDASYTGFAEACARFRYHFQDAYYSDGYIHATSATALKFWFIAVESQPPYAVGFYDLGQPERDFGRTLYKRALRIYAECHEENDWPAYPVEPRTISFPHWGFKERAS